MGEARLRSRPQKGSIMILRTRGRHRWVPSALIASMALIGAALAGTTVANGDIAPPSATPQHEMSDRSQKATLHKKMRALWEQHMEWTYATVAAFAAGTPGLTPTLDRLLQNQPDNGDAIKPFDRTKAGNALTTLLRTHITEAVPVLVAARSGDQAGLQGAITASEAHPPADTHRLS